MPVAATEVVGQLGFEVFPPGVNVGFAVPDSLHDLGFFVFHPSSYSVFRVLSVQALHEVTVEAEWLVSPRQKADQVPDNGQIAAEVG